MANSSTSASDSEDDEASFKRQLLTAVDQSDLSTLQNLFTTSSLPAADIANIKDTGDKNNSLLHIAVKKRNKRKADIKDDNAKIIDLLVKNGANLQFQNDKGETPFHLFKKRFKTWDANDPIPNLLQTATSHKHKKRKIADEDTSMELDELVYKGNERYKSSGLKLNIHGSIYQLQLLMLFLHRAVKRYHDVWLATEFDAAEKFDDAVLKYKKSPKDKVYRWRFLQAKHLLNVDKDRIKKGELFSKNKKQDLKFCLHKYFMSFCKIKKKDEFKRDKLEEFALCTNTYIDEADVKLYFVEDRHFTKDRLLYFDGYEMQNYKLGKAAQISLENVYSHLESTALDSSLMTEFIEKFRLIVRYPDRRKINRILTRELGNYFGLLDSDLATNTLKNYILNWFMSYKDGESEFVLLKDGKSFLKTIRKKIRGLMTAGLSVAYPEQLSNFKIKFDQLPSEVNDFLNSKRAQILYIASEEPVLSAIKLNQFIHRQCKDSHIFLSMKLLALGNVRDLVFESFASEGRHNLLIINSGTNYCVKPGILSSICAKILSTLCSCSLKKVILIGISQDLLKKRMKDANSGLPLKTLNDQISFDSLTTESQKLVLEKTIYFQGTKLALKHIINFESARYMVENKILLKLLKGEEIRIDEDKHVAVDSIYIKRSLRPQVVQSLALHNRQFTSNNCIIISNASLEDLRNMHVDISFVNTDAELRSGIHLSNRERAVLEQHPSAYWLRHFKGYLLFEQYCGNRDTIRQYLVDDTDEELNILEDSLFNTLQKTVIIAADPGFGKSSLISNLGRQKKILDKSLWVKTIKLSKFVSTKYYKSQYHLGSVNFMDSEVKKAAIFLSRMIFANSAQGDSTLFGEKLLELALTQQDNCNGRYPKIILIFDGFDEVCPKYRQETVTLLRALQRSEVSKIWITTRPHESAFLEDALGVVALRLNKFDNDDKFKYISEYQRRLAAEDQDDAYKKLCKCLEKLELEETRSSYLNQFRTTENLLRDVLSLDFTDNPLHLTMLVEVAFNSKDLNFAKLDLASLYEAFKTIKFKRFYDEKTSTSSEVPADDEMRQGNMDYLTEVHGALAFEVLFPDTADIPYTLDEGKIGVCARVGFISIEDNSIQFVHRNFAEVFVAFFLQKNCNNNTVQDIISHVILGNINYRLTRSCLNKCETAASQISNGCKTKFLEMAFFDYAFYIFFEELDNFMKQCVVMLKENSPPIVQALIENLKSFSTPQFDLKYLHNRKLYLLLNTISYNDRLFHMLFKEIVESTSIGFSTVFNRNFNPLICSFMFYSRCNIRDVLELIYQNKPADFINLVKSMFYCMQGSRVVENAELFYYGDFSILERAPFYCCRGGSIIAQAEPNGDLVNLIDTSFCCSRCPNICYQTQNNDFVSLERAKVFCLEHKAIMIYNTASNSFNENHRQYRIEGSDIIFSTTESADYMLQNKPIIECSGGGSIFHVAAKRGRFDYIKESLQWMRLKASIDPLLEGLDIETLRVLNDNEQTFLEVMTYSETFREGFNYILEHCQPSTVRQLLLYHGRAIMRHILINLESNAMKDFLEVLSGYTSIGHEALLHIFSFPHFSLGEDDQTLLHYVTKWPKTEETCVELLLKYCVTYFPPALFKDLLSIRNRYKETMLHKSVRNAGMVLILVEYLGTHFSRQEIEHVLTSKDYKGRTPLHFAAAECNQSKAVVALLELVRHSFGEASVNELLHLPDAEGKNVLQHSCRNSSDQEMGKTLMLYIKDNLQNKSSEFIDLGLSKDSKKKMLFQAANNCESISIEGIFQVLQSSSQLEFIREFLMETDTEGRTILANSGCGNVVKAILQFAQANLDMKHFMRFVFKRDNQGKTAFEVLTSKQIRVYPLKSPILWGDFENILDLFKPAYEELIDKLGKLFNGTEDSSYKVKFYWSELDSIYGYLGECTKGGHGREFEPQRTILNLIGDYQHWTDLGNDEWVLELPLSADV